jgi:hypothetical protein
MKMKEALSNPQYLKMLYNKTQNSETTVKVKPKQGPVDEPEDLQNLKLESIGDKQNFIYQKIIELRNPISHTKKPPLLADNPLASPSHNMPLKPTKAGFFSKTPKMSPR